MISSRKLIKFGRDTSIMEVKDNLQVNDFWKDTGFVETTVHGKYSRIEFNIVDVKNGKKEKANVGEFKMTPPELEGLFQILTTSPNGIKFKERAIIFNKMNKVDSDSFTLMKIHHFYKNDENLSPTYTLKVSYEDAMRNDSKWKFFIETAEGEAECIEHKNGGRLYHVKKGTYKKINEVSFYLNNVEMNSFIRIISRHMRIWEEINYPKMLEYRAQFEKRARDNNYDEDTIHNWNSKETNAEKVEKIENDKSLEPTKENVFDGKCEECGCDVKEVIATFTKQITGKNLCIPCKTNYVNRQSK